MKYPEEYALMAIFETKPILLDLDIPFYYNKITYKFINAEKKEIIFSMTPSCNEVHIKASKENFEIANLSFQYIISLTIQSESIVEKRIILTGEKYV